MTAYAYPRTQLEHRVLAWCNRVRATRGKPPRKTLAKGWCDLGGGNVVRHNVLARTIGGVLVAMSFVGGYSNYSTTNNPLYIRCFLKSFNAGKYPHLEG